MQAQIVTYNAMMEEWVEGQVSSIIALNWVFTGCTGCKTSFIPTESRVVSCQPHKGKDRDVNDVQHLLEPKLQLSAHCQLLDR